MRRVRALALGALLIATTARAVPITQCGQTVPPGQTGDLMNDVVCGGTMGVILTDGATLNLNGFSIVGAGLGFTDPNVPYHGVFAGVLCNTGPNPISGAGVRTCTVNGPGDISNHSIGIWATVSRMLRVADLTIHRNQDGIISNNAKGTLSLINLVVNENTDIGIVGGRRVLGVNVQVDANRNGGISAWGVKMSGLTARGNGQFGGVWLMSSPPRGGRLADSVVKGNNGLLPHWGGGFDIVALKRVRLVNTVCGRSAKVRPTLPGVPYPYQIIGSFNCIPSPSGAFLE